ncbi:hypothetical protein Riv7116_4048 [Rivularia sp. PCC 7116]|uniref:hypothetical protein n=1 Tax=Rivularia sp. PCC 7116 TaxID=373994 RepID=UPI00029EE7E0|nr:hypothetical protein [Rivularia sp. PCC 7116]AFY56487.1 hypothetical protein Riv7116_4048 [Rivularia sp. PCC 7116]
MNNKLLKPNFGDKQLQTTRLKQTNIIPFTIYLVAFVMLLIAWLQPAVSFSILFRDVFVAASVKPYYGLFSNIGIFLWSATAAILLFCGTVLINVNKNHKYSKFLLSFGSLTLLLALDDFFMLHETVFPVLLKISEKVTFLAYAIITAYCLFKFRKIIFNSYFTIFIIAITFLLLSIIVDQLIPASSYLFKVDDGYFFEDSLKFIGIISWCFYFIKISGEQIISLSK